MTKFPPQLIERLQKYFKDRLNQDLTMEEADLYLDSLGSLFLAVWHNRQGRPGQAAAPSGGADGQPP